MNRREMLKFSLFSPLLGLFKKKDVLTVDKLLECKKELTETTGTSSDTSGEVWTYERNYEIKAHKPI